MSQDFGQIPDDTYLVIRDGRTSSPRTLEQLVALAEGGKLRSDDELVQRVMGGSIPIGSAGEQPWFPGNAPPDVPMPATAETGSSASNEPLLKSILTDRWWQVRIGVVAGLITIAGGVLLALRISSDKAEQQVRAAAAAYEADLQSRYRSFKRRFEEYRASPTDPRALVEEMDRFLAELYSPRHQVSSDSADLHLLVSDMRTEVWASLPRVSRDLAQAGVLAKQAAAAFAKDELVEGDSLIARAETLFLSRPQQLPAGLSHADIQSVESLIRKAKSERSDVLAREETRKRRAADEQRAEEERRLAAERAAKTSTRREALLSWVESDRDNEAIFFAAFGKVVKEMVLTGSEAKSTLDSYLQKTNSGQGLEEHDWLVDGFDIRRSPQQSVLTPYQYVLTGTWRFKAAIETWGSLEIKMTRKGLLWDVISVRATCGDCPPSMVDKLTDWAANHVLADLNIAIENPQSVYRSVVHDAARNLTVDHIQETESQR